MCLLTNICVLRERTVPRVKNWTIGENHFQLFSFLGGFLQKVTERIEVNSGNRKKFVHKLATREKRSSNNDDRNHLMRCNLIGRGERIRTSDLTVPNSHPAVLLRITNYYTAR
jgi:hypothetical protein